MTHFEGRLKKQNGYVLGLVLRSGGKKKRRRGEYRVLKEELRFVGRKR